MTASKRSPLEFLPVKFHAFQRALRLPDFISEPLEGELHQRADRFLVVHDEDAASAVTTSLSLARRFGGYLLMPRAGR